MAQRQHNPGRGTNRSLLGFQPISRNFAGLVKTFRSRSRAVTHAPLPSYPSLAFMSAIRFVDASFLRPLNHLICQDDKSVGIHPSRSCRNERTGGEQGLDLLTREQVACWNVKPAGNCSSN